MRKLERDESWVIYQVVTKGVVSGPNAVCELAEWEAMERARPGAQCVVQMGLATEGLASSRSTRAGSAASSTGRRSQRSGATRSRGPRASRSSPTC